MTVIDCSLLNATVLREEIMQRKVILRPKLRINFLSNQGIVILVSSALIVSH